MKILTVPDGKGVISICMPPFSEFAFCFLGATLHEAVCKLFMNGVSLFLAFLVVQQTEQEQYLVIAVALMIVSKQITNMQSMFTAVLITVGYYS